MVYPSSPQPPSDSIRKHKSQSWTTAIFSPDNHSNVIWLNAWLHFKFISNCFELDQWETKVPFNFSTCCLSQMSKTDIWCSYPQSAYWWLTSLLSRWPDPLPCSFPARRSCHAAHQMHFSGRVKPGKGLWSGHLTPWGPWERPHVSPPPFLSFLGLHTMFPGRVMVWNQASALMVSLVMY